MARVTTAAGAAVAVSIALAGCTPTTEHASTVAATPPTIWTGAPAPDDRSVGTLHQYIVDNQIAEVPFKPNDPGTPKVDFPFPPDWSPAGDRTPDWAYGAIVYDKAKDPENPPFIVAIASKLTGNIDPAQVLKYAPAQLNELPDFKPFGPPEKDSLSGFQAIDYTGTYMWEGQARAVGQQTIVVPGKDGLFVFQLNGDAPKGEEQPVLDAAKLIIEQTKITLPA
ncbi:MAG: LpqN/LpqT family lipoprotein [Mycobacterium sp.]|nr:LpqN/LpqT family lipoprotein [Mycobacterium sp.]